MTVSSFKLASAGRSDRRKRIERSYFDISENRQMISRAVAVPGIFQPRREIRQLISCTETVPGPFSLRGWMVSIDNGDPPTYSFPWKGARMIG